jgi:hypothetical protein
MEVISESAVEVRAKVSLAGGSALDVGSRRGASSVCASSSAGPRPGSSGEALLQAPVTRMRAISGMVRIL